MKIQLKDDSGSIPFVAAMKEISGIGKAFN
jgi:hypothetical protein